MSNCFVYEPEFYKKQIEGSMRSAKAVVPVICKLLRPASVIDVGCGCGTWLAVFSECGVHRILGLDGEYVARSSLVIPPDCFRPVDLTRPPAVNERFDLATCLEVAEHLPRSKAPGLVDFLIKLAPVVVFSAAVPMQGGTHHVNERWPGYWTALFKGRGYVRIDAVRKFIWKDRDVEWWYRQNIFIYVDKNQISSYPGLRAATEEPDDLVLIHQDILEKLVSLPETLRRLPARILGELRRGIRGEGPKHLDVRS